jgi:hypothetical protein
MENTKYNDTMIFLLSHTIFSQLEFEVTTDHYMSTIT